MFVSGDMRGSVGSKSFPLLNPGDICCWCWWNWWWRWWWDLEEARMLAIENGETLFPCWLLEFGFRLTGLGLRVTWTGLDELLESDVSRGIFPTNSHSTVTSLTSVSRLTFHRKSLKKSWWKLFFCQNLSQKPVSIKMLSGFCESYCFHLELSPCGCSARVKDENLTRNTSAASTCSGFVPN